MTFEQVGNVIVETLLPLVGERESINIATIYLEDRFEKKGFVPESLTKSESKIFENDLAQFRQGIPVQYIVGKAFFMDHFFKVSPDVLIPRPETEELVSFALGRLRLLRSNGRIPRVLEIGTGSGCIAISLKHRMPEIRMLAMDVSLPALELARQNARDTGTDIEFDQWDFLEKSNWDSVPEMDLIISNPPYIDREEKVHMPEGVYSFEPELALFTPGTDPLVFYRRMLEFGEIALRYGGEIVAEINEFRAKDLRKLCQQYTDYKINLYRDLQDKYRILHAIKVRN